MLLDLAVQNHNDDCHDILKGNEVGGYLQDGSLIFFILHQISSYALKFGSW